MSTANAAVRATSMSFTGYEIENLCYGSMNSPPCHCLYASLNSIHPAARNVLSERLVYFLFGELFTRGLVQQQQVP